MVLVLEGPAIPVYLGNDSCGLLFSIGRYLTRLSRTPDYVLPGLGFSDRAVLLSRNRIVTARMGLLRRYRRLPLKVIGTFRKNRFWVITKKPTP